MANRSKYYHEWYEKHKEERQQKHASTYNSYESYVKLADVKKVLTTHKKDIGIMSHTVLLEEINVLERVRLHGEMFNQSTQG